MATITLRAPARPGGVHSTGHSLRGVHVADRSASGTITLARGPAPRPIPSRRSAPPPPAQRRISPNWGGPGGSGPGGQGYDPSGQGSGFGGGGGGSTKGSAASHHAATGGGVGGGFGGNGTPDSIVLNPSPLVPGSGFTLADHTGGHTGLGYFGYMAPASWFAPSGGSTVGASGGGRTGGSPFESSHGFASGPGAY